jgi:hypothetical protein
VLSVRFSLAVALAASACGTPRASPDECANACTHYIDLGLAADPELAKLDGGPLAAARDMKRAVALGVAPYGKVSRCKDVTRPQAECATRATTQEAWEACVP